ncbi:MAG: zinc ribbon domain-containing protein [Candidatus Aenigmarchaeota archaeon]|nr:zinc ribbon domain-containing protein [Candidatus Aenigmarchaeota archaeon]
MACEACGARLEKGWKFCPSCGSQQSRGFFNISDLFSRMRKEMEVLSREMDRDFDKEIEALDLSPYFKRPRGQGFTIKIVSGTGREPRIDVQTFGDVDRQTIQQQLERQLGYRSAKTPTEKPLAIPAPQRKSLVLPKMTEEPATEIRQLGTKVAVDLNLPGVKGDRDIEITDLESSVEVKAVAGDKAYFKILTKPQDSAIVQRSFKDGKLHLEFA